MSDQPSRSTVVRVRVTDSLSLVITLLPAFGLKDVVVIPREERYLTGKFPVEYAAYMASVRRWL